jgi:NAD(P)-dependent dehydrogenase (short-subunit alcohol dehydrogenase family)
VDIIGVQGMTVVERTPLEDSMVRTGTGEVRVALVTGAGQGIGRGLAMRLLDEGYRVAMVEVDAEAGQEALEASRERGEAMLVVADVSREEDVARAVDEVIKNFGRIDVVVNNAALADPYNGPIDELALEVWNRVLAVNLTGPFLVTRATLPHLRKAHGVVINIASTRALQSEADTEAYSASKGGLVALTHALANSCGPEVRVNCISPGWIDVSQWKKQTDRKPLVLSHEDHAQHPVGRVGQVEDVAALVAFLASDEAGFMTGQNLVLDGGMVRKMIYV